MTSRDARPSESSLPHPEASPDGQACHQPDDLDDLDCELPIGPIAPIPYRYTPPGAPFITYLKLLPDDFKCPLPEKPEVILPSRPIAPIPYRYTPPGAPFITYLKLLPDDYICPGPENLRDDMLQAEHVAELDQVVRSHFSSRSDAVVDSGGYLFYDRDDMSRHRVRPDLSVSFGVDAESVRERDGYVVHEAGKPPDFALEVASRSTRRRDTGIKRVLYAEIGIGEYWRFDPKGGLYYGYELAGEILSDGEYRPIELTVEEDGMIWGYSPMLDLCLCVKDWRLLFYDRKTGSYLRNFAEEQAAHQETAAERDAERTARQAAESEADRLREELRRLRGE